MARAAASHSCDRHAELLRVAREEFAERGYAATTTRHLAHRMGLAPGSLYHHIGSKQDVLAELIDGVVRPLQEVLNAALDSQHSATERLTRLARAHVAVLLQDPVAVKLILTDVSALDLHRRSAILDAQRRYRAGVQSVILDGQRRGEFRPAPSALVATQFLLGALNWTPRWVDADGALPQAEVAEAIIDVLLNGALVPSAHGVRLNAAERDTLIDPRTRRGPTHAVAASVFLRHGYEAASMADLAAALEISKATLYKRVRTKRGLLYGILDRTLSTAVGTVEALAAHDGPAAARLRAAFELHVERQMGDLDGSGLAIYAERALDEEQRGRIAAMGKRYGAAWRALFEVAVAEGVARPGLRPSLAAGTVLGTLNWLHRWYRPDGPLSPRDVGAAAADVILAGLAAPLGGRRP